ncbi:MAG: VanZ family protein [Ignavibacteriaceae bacterium]|nr:VanZ family protein [Ignavibacteriaceae bacterium]
MLYNFFEKNKNIAVYAPLIAYWIVLFLATTLPTTKIPHTGINDKIEHLLGYFLLAFLLSNTLYFQNKNKIFKKFPISIALLIVALYGIVDEVHQYFIPGRLCDFYDWTADVTGALAAGVMYFMVKKYFQSAEGRQKPV